MLLFVRKVFAEALRSGAKTLEIRAGARYTHLRAGDTVSINGRFRLRVVQVEHFQTRAECLHALRGRHRAAGCATPALLRAALEGCYPTERPPYVVLTVEQERAPV